MWESQLFWMVTLFLTLASSGLFPVMKGFPFAVLMLGSGLDGILVLVKPHGPTSHDIVALVPDVLGMPDVPQMPGFAGRCGSLGTLG